MEIVEYAVEHLRYLRAPGANPPEVFNIANPWTVQFKELLPYFADVAPVVISGERWVDLLEACAARERTPGEKLTGFYRRAMTSGLSNFEIATDNLLLASETARNLKPVDEKWVRLWLEQWGYRSIIVRARL